MPRGPKSTALSMTGDVKLEGNRRNVNQTLFLFGQILKDPESFVPLVLRFTELLIALQSQSKNSRRIHRKQERTVEV